MLGFILIHLTLNLTRPTYQAHHQVSCFCCSHTSSKHGQVTTITHPASVNGSPLRVRMSHSAEQGLNVTILRGAIGAGPGQMSAKWDFISIVTRKRSEDERRACQSPWKPPEDVPSAGPSLGRISKDEMACLFLIHLHLIY